MWEGLEPATCWPDHCFCEAVRDGWVRQPSNTWSSLTFCLAAAFIFAERGESSRLTRGQQLAFAAAVFLVGATSAVYHASLSFIGQWLDVQSMYLLVLAAVAVNLDTLRGGRAPRFWTVYVAGNVLLGVLLLVAAPARRYAFGLAIAAILITELSLRRRRLRDWPSKMLWAATAVQALAFGIWILDTTRTVCFPTSPVQGHAVWHTLGAVASYLLWRYFRGPRVA